MCLICRSTYLIHHSSNTSLNYIHCALNCPELCMKVGIAVLNEGQKSEILQKQTNPAIIVEWVTTTAALLQVADADFWIDCTFSGDEVPVTEKPLLIHAPVLTLTQMKAPSNVGRFCAWNTFIKREIWEIAITTDTDSAWISKLMHSIGWKFLLVKDEPGMIAPRIICNIINEAHFALQAGVSSEEEIDLAMRLGTNYPLGPLEWGKKIGLQQVRDLLQNLSEMNAIYYPAFTA